MAVFSIPVTSELFDYSERVELDGEVFELRFRFNNRLEAWFVDIFSASGDVLVYGRRLTVDTRLTGQYKHLDDLAQGELTPFDTENGRRDPSSDNLGDRVLLFYFESSEFAGLEVV